MGINFFDGTNFGEKINEGRNLVEKNEDGNKEIKEFDKNECLCCEYEDKRTGNSKHNPGINPASIFGQNLRF